MAAVNPDGVKFAQKEDVTPRAADRGVFKLAPAVSMFSYLLALAAIPFTPSLVAGDLPASLVYVLAVSGIGTVATLMAGFGSGNKYATLGAFRSAAQLVSYEVPLILACASFAMAAGSLSISGIVHEWHPIWLLWQLPGAFVLLVAMTAELQRPPFDMPVADSEVVMGVMTEYTGLRFALFLLSEYAGIVVMSALFAALYLGGWNGPFEGALGFVWMLLKTAVVAFVILRQDGAEGSQGDELVQELRNHVAKEIGPIAKPRSIMIVPELPKTRSGKIMRRLLRDVAEGREVGDTTTLADTAVMSVISAQVK